MKNSIRQSIVKSFIAMTLFAQAFVTPTGPAMAAQNPKIYFKPALFRFFNNPTGSAKLSIGNRAGQLAAEVELPKIQKDFNAIKYIRSKFKETKTTLKTKGPGAIKDFSLMMPTEVLVFFLALGAISKIQLFNEYGDNPVSFMQHLEAHDFTTEQGWIGIASLATFILGSRSTDALMLKLVKDSKNKDLFLPYIPYIGMSGGLLTSDLFGELMQFEHLTSCTSSLQKRSEMNDSDWANCEKAYDSFLEFGYEKMQSLTPTIIAMIASTIAGGLIESATIHRVIHAKAVQFTWILDNSLNLATLFSGRGLVKVIYKAGVQFVPQTIIQNAIEPSIANLTTNLLDGNDLSQLETEIMSQIKDKKEKGWTQDSKNRTRDLDLTLTKFKETSLAWRKANLHKEIAAYQNWQVFLNNFTRMYLATKKFYTFYVEQMAAKNTATFSQLFSPDFLNGVTPLNPTDNSPKETPSPLLENRIYRKLQVLRLIRARKEMELLIESNKSFFESQSPDIQNEFLTALKLMPTEDVLEKENYDLEGYKKSINTINKNLNIRPDLGKPFFSTKSSDTDLTQQYEQLGEAQKVATLNAEKITKLKTLSEEEKAKLLQQNQDYYSNLKYSLRDRQNGNKKDGYFDDYREFYSYWRKLIGNPLPIEARGYSFLKSFEKQYILNNDFVELKYPTTEIITDLKNNLRLSNIGDLVNSSLQYLGFADEHSTAWREKKNTLNYLGGSQYITSRMILGSDLQSNESILSFSKNGFPANFLPPKILAGEVKEIAVQEAKLISESSLPTIFNTPLVINDKKHSSVMEAILTQPLSPNILNYKNGFQGWWADNVETQFLKAGAKFEDEYQKIMVRIYEQYKFANTNPMSWKGLAKSGLSMNAPLSNGLQLSYRQERRLYLMILGEILKDNARLVSGDSIPDFSLSQKEPTNISASRGLKGFASRLNEDFKGNSLNRTGSPDLGASSLISQVPVLDFLKNSEVYDLNTILRSYTKIQFPLFSNGGNRHFLFQDQIERGFQNIEYLMDQMKITQVQTTKIMNDPMDASTDFETSEKILTTEITNSQIFEYSKKLEEQIKSLEASLNKIFPTDAKTNSNLTPAEIEKNSKILKITKACIKGLNSIKDQQTTLGSMINAVSFKRALNGEGAILKAGPSSMLSPIRTKTGINGLHYVSGSVDKSKDPQTKGAD